MSAIEEHALPTPAATWPEPRRAPSATSIGVIVPTYRRPADLRRCLAALAAQKRPAEQLVVARREDDEATCGVIREMRTTGITIKEVCVTSPGVVAALNAALDVVSTDVVAFTDDDAAPRPDWLLRMEARYAADPALGGVGGRDWVHQQGRTEDGSERTVGRVTWWGRCIGNHHLGAGPPRDVDALKGVNMSFRAAALAGIRFDTRLLGAGAQVFNELGVSLAVRRRGWRLLYDPEIAVDHYPSIRHDADKRNVFARQVVYDTAYNETLLISEHLGPMRRYVFLVWAFLVGHHASPGLAQWIRLLIREPRTATARVQATVAARISAWRTHLPKKSGEWS